MAASFRFSADDYSSWCSAVVARRHASCLRASEISGQTTDSSCSGPARATKKSHSRCDRTGDRDGLVSGRQVAVDVQHRQRTMAGSVPFVASTPKPWHKKLLPIRSISSISPTSLLTIDGSSSRPPQTHRTRSPRSTWYPRRVVRGHASPTAGTGTTSLAGLPMDGPSISFPDPAASSMSGASASIRLREKPVGQPFQVTKFDSPRLMIPRFIPPVGLSLTQDKLVLTMAQESGNIWVLDNVDR